MIGCFTELDHYLSRLVREYPIPGCDVLVMQAHQVLYRKQYGFSDLEKQTPVTGKEQYYLFSCTKPITVAGVMRLWEEGKFELDEPVEKWIPSFRNVYMLGSDGTKIPPKHPMTLRHLLTMTAGFDYRFTGPSVVALFESGKDFSATDFANAAIQRPLVFDPGERFQYSICHDLLGAVVEAITGESFAAYQRRVIFEPLGMERTGFLPERGKTLTPVPLYQCTIGDREVRRTDNPFCAGLSPHYASGGAGLVGTIEDYAKFADAMANHGEAGNGYRLLKPATVDLIRSEQLTLTARDPAFSCSAGHGYGYGLGVRTRIDQNEGQRSPIGEFGWDGAAGSYVMMDPQNKVSVVLTTHLLSWSLLLGTMHEPVQDAVYRALGL